ncbi:EXS family-domain-containing protein [Copromyces sp. CBS 386.78]|nr:EXS family-domain-containing protein [Copromyces sp. CBS 386.78]
MKFAKELEQEAVPEWRVKYLNYKLGKKLIKSVTRAIQRASTTPTLARRPDSQHPLHATPAALFHQRHHKRTPTQTHHQWSAATPGPHEDSPGTDYFPRGSPELGRAPAKIRKHSIESRGPGERSSLTTSPDSGIRYGSIVPPSRSSDRTEFELPAPAMKTASRTGGRRDSIPTSPVSNRFGPRRSKSMMIGAAQAGQSSATESSVDVPPSATIAQRPAHLLTRLLSTSSHLPRTMSNKDDIGLQNLDTVRTAEVEFFSFLDNELDKIETFYKQKEDQATKRLTALREQLHEMRNRRTTEISDAKQRKEMEGSGGSRSHSDEEGAGNGKDNGVDWIGPIRTKFIKPGPNSKALQKMTRTPVMAPKNPEEGRDYVRRPPNKDDVPYRVAKRKLKLALQEFYRGLELLKSYALLNRTAFRKLNKKYDKAVNARPTYRYMNEKVNKTWFVNSDILDGHIHTVEDLYARYFEKGNHKLAAGKLRNILRRPGDASDSAFRSGLLVGFGAVFAVQGLIYGAELLFQDDHVLKENTSYLLQLYGGYFLMIMLFTLFTLACRIWTKNKVNYPFIFEFDTRHSLEWKQLAEFPAFFFALLGVFIWINFSRFGDWEEMYLYYPVILIGVSLLILFFPAPIFYHRARRWFLYSHYRLLLAGLYPVEFRDFFLGDIWCSLTYASSNIALFFCLYANEWDQPSMCNSSHSRLLGFFNALPPIWRALQCIRRYYDTKNVFPHLVNCGKYMCTIITAVLLSLYRFNGSKPNLAVYITFACINACYTSIWDLFMDFSLLQKHVRHPFLRDITALKSKWIYYAIMIVDPILRFNWIFYAIFTHDTQHSTIVSFFVAFAEVIRRGLWLILRVENEHCANVSQYKASRDTPLPYQLDQFIERPSQETPAEDLEVETGTTTGAAAQRDRRGTISSMAASIRERIRGSVVAGATAPWTASTPTGDAHQEEGAASPRQGSVTSPGGATNATPGVTGTGTGFNLNGGGTFRRRHNESMGKKSILKVMAEAHKQDFEKRRPPEAIMEQGLGRRGSSSLRDEDDEEEDDDDPDLRSEVEDEDDDDSDRRSVQEDRMEAREAETLVRRGRGEPDDSVSE